jgi:CheY-like chemotaxis protein
MDHPTLRGRSILVVEDDPIVAMDILTALELAGANATTTTTVHHALLLAEHDGLAAAIMDHALSDGDSTQLCARLKARGIPYVSYSGYAPVEGASEDSVFIAKPVSMDVLMNALEGLLVGKPPRVS